MSLDQADSPVSSSPNGSKSITVKRAAVTYSRKRHVIDEEGLSSVPAAGDWDEVHTRKLPSVNDEPLFSSNSSRLSGEASAGEDIERGEAPGFVFAWKKKLAEWSDQEEPDSPIPNANKQLSAKLSRPRPIGTPETSYAATKYSLDSDASPEQLFAIDDGHGGPHPPRQHRMMKHPLGLHHGKVREKWIQFHAGASLHCVSVRNYYQQWDRESWRALQVVGEQKSGK